MRQEYKIPTLYLMDSMIKNLGGDFLEELAKGIVGVFCHAFESMVCVVMGVSVAMDYEYRFVAGL